jgi:L-malate glycosyltransferase
MNHADALPRVLFVQRRLPHYRVAFVQCLRDWLAERGVLLDFVHGDCSASERSKQDEGQLSWAQRARITRYFLHDKAVWQPVRTTGYDLVIVGQENRLLFNHWLCRPWRPFKLGFFGHGANFAARNRKSISERLRRLSARQADWWFAYTSISAGLVAGAGVRPDHITVVNNATDTHDLKQQLMQVTPAALQQLRQRHDLSSGQTALFLGSIYAGKGLELLIEAMRLLAQDAPKLRLLVVGDGPSLAACKEAARGIGSVHFLGALMGADKAAVMAASDFMVMPGSVGLSIVDAFAAGLPLLTTQMQGHGPEIAYLAPGKNGDMTEATAPAIAQAMQRLAGDAQLLVSWQKQARRDGDAYSVQAMAQRFGQGVLQALQRPGA